MYVQKTIYSRYIGMPQEHQIPMYPKKNTSELHKIKQSRCIHPSKSIKISNPRCHILSLEANLRANHSEIHQNSPKTAHPDVSLFIQYRHLVVVIVLEVVSFRASEVYNQKHD